jgi:hypothetical protein
VVLAAWAVVVVGVPRPALADPAGPDGGSATLQGQLQQAAQGYNDAKGRLDTAKARQAELTAQAQATEAELTALTTQVQAVAVTAYKGGRIGTWTVLLDSGSADDFLDRATSLQTQLRRDNDALRRLHDARVRYDQQRAAISTEVAAQQNQLALMDKRKRDAQNALAAASGGAAANGPSGGAATATPSPRNPDGSWPKESCSVKDPTTSGCLTPRTLHALQEVQKAGVTHYVACFRNGTWGEHPLGRACDFAANATGFVNAAATGADKAYGDRLAGWLIANADRLAVLYIIWYRQIWMPGTGWRTYHGDGTPAGDHMNHVHLSVQ